MCTLNAEPFVHAINPCCGIYDQENEVWVKGRNFGPTGNFWNFLTILIIEESQL
jgi:hypothetical protein